MMNNKQHISYRLLSTVAVLSILIGSVVILHHDISFQRVFAQQATNPTVRQAPGQSSEDLVKSLMSPKSLMESVINQTRNTNATNFAAKQIVSKVNGTNSTAAGINGTNSTAAGINGTNSTAAGINGTNSTAAGINSVIQKLQNTNATNFATHAIIDVIKR
jgi:hypothetical protein